MMLIAYEEGGSNAEGIDEERAVWWRGVFTRDLNNWIRGIGKR